MTIVEKIKSSIMSATQLTCYYGSAEDLNVILDTAQQPAVLLFLLKEQGVTESAGQLRERVNVALFFTDMQAIDSYAEGAERVIDKCKERAMTWVQKTRRSSQIRITAINGSNRIYAEYDTQLCGYAINVTIEELIGQTAC